MIVDQEVFMTTGMVLVLLGIASISYSKNLVKSVMSFQVVVFGVNLALFAAGFGQASRLTSDTFVFMSILVGASAEAVGLAIAVTVFRRYGTLNPMEIRRLRG
jgi:multicomponent Na+:H+ antiporter subunit C